MRLEELTNFGMKNSLSLSSLESITFNILSDGNDESVFTYTDLLT